MYDVINNNTSSFRPEGLRVPPGVNIGPRRVDMRTPFYPGPTLRTLPAGLSDVLDPNAPDPALYQPRTTGAATGGLWIMDKVLAKNAAMVIQSRLNMGWPDGLDTWLLKYLPVKKLAILVFERGVPAEHQRYIVQAMRQPLAIITSQPDFNSRIDRLAVENGFIYAFIKDADTLVAFNNLEGRTVKLEVGKQTWTLTPVPIDAEQLKAQTIFLCMSKPWKERCKTVDMYNPDADRPVDEFPTHPGQVFATPPPPPPAEIIALPPQPQPRSPYEPIAEPSYLPQPIYDTPIQWTVPVQPQTPVQLQPLTPLDTTLPYDAACLGFTTKAAWKAAGQPRCPAVVESPPFQVQPAPYDPGVISLPTRPTVPVIQPATPGYPQTIDTSGSIPGGTSAAPAAAAAPSDPNLIFGFPKQQVMIGAALLVGLMMLKK